MASDARQTQTETGDDSNTATVTVIRCTLIPDYCLRNSSFLIYAGVRCDYLTMQFVFVLISPQVSIAANEILN